MSGSGVSAVSIPTVKRTGKVVEVKTRRCPPGPGAPALTAASFFNQILKVCQDGNASLLLQKAPLGSRLPCQRLRSGHSRCSLGSGEPMGTLVRTFLLISRRIESSGWPAPEAGPQVFGGDPWQHHALLKGAKRNLGPVALS